jgi:hypothetical protein
MHAIDLGSMFLLGLFGSGHCVGMCGPIVVSLPRDTRPITVQLLYNLGRISTYSLIGAVLAAIGGGFLVLGEDADPLAGVKRVQLGLSLLAAVGLLLFGLARLGVVGEPGWLHAPSLDRIPGVGALLKRLFAGRTLASVWALGLVMGLLPCGLSFAAFARALPAGGAWQGAALVAAFGAGTLPALFVVGTAAQGLLRKHRRLSDLLSGVVMLGMGASLAVDALLGVL